VQQDAGIPVVRVVDKKRIIGMEDQGGGAAQAGLPDGLFSTQKSQFG
jgi:hypothetical protein